MTILFTPEDLVRYIYNDLPPEKAAALEAAMQEDWTLREKFDVLKASTENLDKALESPRTETILKVLNYARETAPETAH